MEGRALVESAGSFVRKKSFNMMYKQATVFHSLFFVFGATVHNHVLKLSFALSALCCAHKSDCGSDTY